MRCQSLSALWMAGVFVPESPYLFLPAQGSTSAGHVDALFSLLYWMSALITIGVLGVLGYFLFRRSGESAPAAAGVTPYRGNAALEITWTVVPLTLAIALFFYGFKGYVELLVAPKDATDIQANSKNWTWSFAYANGLTESVLHVPVDTSVRLVLGSADTLHSLAIPAFRVKADAVPGRSSQLWFRATKVGEFPVHCGEYCGPAHSDGVTRVVVHEPGGFEKWLEGREKELMDKPPADVGKMLFAQQGCATCHSIDGSPMVGPTFKGLFGRDEALADGSTVKVDDAYIKESIADPQAKIVKGFSPAMPAFKDKLKEDELHGLVEYIKTLK